MSFEFFQVPTADPDPESQRLNQFLKTHRIIKVDKHFFTDGTDAYWSFCVSWLHSDSDSQTGKRDTRIDYRKVLEENQFTVYSALRELRKQLAEKEGIPIYAVATNEQLAEMVKQKVASLTSLQQIPRFGKAKTERYGEPFLALLQQRLADATLDKTPTNDPPPPE